MSRQLAAVLRDWLIPGEAEAAVEGRPPSPWLFPGPDDQPLNRERFDVGVWRPILRRASVRYRPPHYLRHAYASFLIAQGESLAYVRDQLGHHSIKLTVDTYGHWLPGSNRQAVDRLDAIGPSVDPPAHPGAASFRKLDATALRRSEATPVFAHLAVTVAVLLKHLAHELSLLTPPLPRWGEGE